MTEKCRYCGIEHADVEASGIYYCPNPLCAGAGAACWRAKMRTYRPTVDDRHTVNPEFGLPDGIRMALATGDPVVIKAARKSAIVWLDDMINTMRGETARITTEAILK